MPSNGNNNTRSKAPNYNKTANTNGTVREVFARRMKEERIKKGLTQQELADLTITSLDTIKRYESGKSKGLRLEVAYEIARVLSVSLDSLLPPYGTDLEQELQRAEAAMSRIREMVTCKN